MNKKRKGVTLMELIIAMGLISVIIALSFFFFSANNRKINELQIRSELQADAGICMKYISKNVMEASKGEIVISPLNEQNIVLDTISDIGNKIEDGVQFVFDSDKRQLIMKTKVPSDGSYSDKIICSNVSSFLAWLDGEDGINIELSLENKGITYKITDSFIFRNKHLN